MALGAVVGRTPITHSMDIVRTLVAKLLQHNLGFRLEHFLIKNEWLLRPRLISQIMVSRCFDYNLTNQRVRVNADAIHVVVEHQVLLLQRWIMSHRDCWWWSRVGVWAVNVLLGFVLYSLMEFAQDHALPGMGTANEFGGMHDLGLVVLAVSQQLKRYWTFDLNALLWWYLTRREIILLLYVIPDVHVSLSSLAVGLPPLLLPGHNPLIIDLLLNSRRWKYTFLLNLALSHLQNLSVFRLLELRALLSQHFRFPLLLHYKWQLTLFELLFHQRLVPASPHVEGTELFANNVRLWHLFHAEIRYSIIIWGCGSFEWSFGIGILHGLFLHLVCWILRK